MHRFFLLGHPVSHSLSPNIHQLFAKEANIDIRYELRDIEPGRFIEEMAVLRRECNPFGANVTVPFKRDAAEYCDVLTARAKSAGAVNTLRFEEAGVLGDNTDGVGFVRDVTERYAQPFKGQRVLILGAGGAARGVLAALTECACASITVAARRAQSAQALAMDFGHGTQAKDFTELTDLRYDVVINSTSAGLENSAPAVPSSVFKECALAYDLMYGVGDSPFMRDARNADVRCVADGLGMLVEQAAESFRVWLGFSPDTDKVYSALRAHLQNSEPM